MALARKGSRQIVVDGTGRAHPSNWVGRAAEPVLPSDVAAAVRLALRKRWTPTAPGSAFHLAPSSDFTASL